MKDRFLFSLLLLFFILSTPIRSQTVVTAKIDGAINPAAAEFLHRSLQKATEIEAECLIVYLNTPGGLLKSTRVIVSDFLSAKVPVVVYVSPSGSQAASAGVFITLAGHVAAMAPGTNIGAAHPVSLQGQQDSIMMEKALNDAAAFIRTIAENRKRNLAWAEQAVRKSLSITETEALKERVIDLIAKDLTHLLEQLDGRKIETVSGEVTLQTRNAKIETLEMGWAENILNILSDPNIAYILLMLGVYGLLFELYNPGAIFPGVVGVISIILAFYSLHTLPVNYAGLALIIFAIILFIAELKIPSYGLLTIGGIISFVLGSIMLIRSESGLEFIAISESVIITTVSLTIIFFLFVIGFGLKAQRRKPTTGSAGIIGEVGVTSTALNPNGKVKVHGEIWNAVTVSGKITKGERVKVVSIESFTLKVDKTK